MPLGDILQEMISLLHELETIDLGYPLGENAVHPVTGDVNRRADLVATNRCAAKWLAGLYLACDGLSLTDVHVGYFIKPLNRLLSCDPSSEPSSVLLDREFQVAPFGSTGGGDVFVVDCEGGRIFMLPPGPFDDGRYDARANRIREVAKSVEEFLKLLLVDLAAFLDGDDKHPYIANI